MFSFYKVTGDSMEPTITSGSYVFAFKKLDYNVNDIVVVNITKDLKIIKRIISINNHKIKLSGDNNTKSSSLCEPWYLKKQVESKIIFNFSFIDRFFKTKEPSHIS